MNFFNKIQENIVHRRQGYGDGRFPYFDRARSRSRGFYAVFTVAICLVLSAVIAVSAYFSALHFTSSFPVLVASPVVPALAEEIYAEVAPYNPMQALTVNLSGAELSSSCLEKFRAISAVSDDVVGWLTVPNTGIDTPVVQSDDNSFYLRRDLYGTYTRYGNAFLDYRCRSLYLSKSSIIYAHATDNNQQVFYDLNKYREIDFYKSSPVITYSTLYREYKWKVFAAFITTTAERYDNGYAFNYIYPDMSDSNFEGFLKQVDERAFYKTGVDVLPEDKILVLSTCTYDFGVYIDTRLVVVARLVRDGENEEIDTSLVKDNPDYRRPQYWYNRNDLVNPYKNSEKWEPSPF